MYYFVYETTEDKPWAVFELPVSNPGPQCNSKELWLTKNLEFVLDFKNFPTNFSSKREAIMFLKRAKNVVKYKRKNDDFCGAETIFKERSVRK